MYGGSRSGSRRACGQVSAEAALREAFEGTLRGARLIRHSGPTVGSYGAQALQSYPFAFGGFSNCKIRDIYDLQRIIGPFMKWKNY